MLYPRPFSIQAPLKVKGKKTKTATIATDRKLAQGTQLSQLQRSVLVLCKSGIPGTSTQLHKSALHTCARKETLATFEKKYDPEKLPGGK